MSENSLYFTVLGSSGAGKTTLLACMNKFFSEMFPGVSFSPRKDSQSFDALSNDYKLLEDEANNSEHLDFEIAVKNTEDKREYAFNLEGKTHKFPPVHFYDFPGGWLSPKTESEMQNSAKLAEIVNRSEVIFVVVDMPYLMEYNGKYAEHAKIAEIQKLLLQSLQDSSRDRLVLIVPMKCEKYRKELDNLYERIQNEFRDTIEFAQSNSDRVALAVAPVCTVGNAKFSRFNFSADGKEIVGQIFLKQANSKFAPEYTDQPLRMAMSFFLSHFDLSQARDFRDIADDIKKGLKHEQTRILSGEGLITGEAVRKHRDLIPIEPVEVPCWVWQRWQEGSSQRSQQVQDRADGCVGSRQNGLHWVVLQTGL